MMTSGYTVQKQERKPVDRHLQDGEILTRLTHKIGRSTGACSSATHALLNGADRDPELRMELLHGIEEELHDIQLVLENVAAWRALELDSFKLRRRSVDLKTWLFQMLARWEQAVERKGLTWRLEVPAYLPSPSVDPDRLTQVFNNLLVNAMDYTPAGGEIGIEAGVQGRDIWLKVTNSAPDLPAQELVQVFEPFFSSSHQGRFPKGIGLGLAIARHIVELHGGRMTVESELDRGLSFCFWLPGPLRSV